MSTESLSSVDAHVSKFSGLSGELVAEFYRFFGSLSQTRPEEQPSGLKRLLALCGEELHTLAERVRTGECEPTALAHAQRYVLESIRVVRPIVAPALRKELNHFLIDFVDYDALAPMRVGAYEFTDVSTFDSAQWERNLGHLRGRDDVSFLEIGSYEGKSACWMLDNVLTSERSRLVCVDLFVHNADRDRSVERRFDANIAASGARHRVFKLAGHSHAVLPLLPAASFDFIYIDASHAGADVMQDGVLSWRLLKVGGLVTFDDYGLPENFVTGPSMREAVDAFVAMYGGRAKVIHRDFQLSLEKLGE